LIKLAHEAHAWSREQFPALLVSLGIEDKASGQSAIQTLRFPVPTLNPDGTHGPTLPALPIAPIPVAAGETKESRAESITPPIEGGRVFIPRNAPWLGEWLEEHQKFPAGKHDDQVDTTVMGVRRALRRLGGLA
jgi:phage terminase large subunit-like protein